MGVALLAGVTSQASVVPYPWTTIVGDNGAIGVSGTSITFPQTFSMDLGGGAVYTGEFIAGALTIDNSSITGFSIPAVPGPPPQPQVNLSFANLVAGANTSTLRLTRNSSGDFLDLSVTWADISVTDVVGYGKSANLPNSGGANLKWVFMSGSGSDENLDTLKTGQHGLSLTFEGDFTSVSDLEGKNKTYNYTGTIVNVVPEPSTVIAGMVLLLPFGASTVRLLRKGRASR